MDIEDINFLQDLAEEMRRISPDYNAEAIELENIVYRESRNNAEDLGIITLIDIMMDFYALVWENYINYEGE